MSTVNELRQAYKELPWRKKARYLALSLAAILAAAGLFFLEVHFSTQAIVLGRRIQSLQIQIQQAQFDSAILQSRLAKLNSLEHLESEAKALGYRPLAPGQVRYVPVPAWALKQNPRPTPVPPRPSRPLPRKYTISLFEWLTETLLPARGNP